MAGRGVLSDQRTRAKIFLPALPIVTPRQNNDVNGHITGERLCLIKYPKKVFTRHTRLFTGIYAHIPRARDYIQAIEKEKIKFIDKNIKNYLTKYKQSSKIYNVDRKKSIEQK